MFAIVRAGGKQYRVSPGEKIRIEKISGVAGDSVTFHNVFLTADGDRVRIGAPVVSGAAVEGTIVRQGRAEKVIVFKYHSKTRYKKKKGHRQAFTEVQITNIK